MSRVNDQLDTLRQRIDRLEEAVGDVRDHLKDCLQVDRPQNALALARGVVESLTRDMLEKMGLKPSSTLDACIAQLETPKTLSRGLVRPEIITLLHMVRVIGNKATHDVMAIAATTTEVELVLRSVLRVVEWYFSEFDRGPRTVPLFKPGVGLQPLRGDQLLPDVGMPSLVVVGPDRNRERRKVFIPDRAQHNPSKIADSKKTLRTLAIRHAHRQDDAGADSGLRGVQALGSRIRS